MRKTLLVIFLLLFTLPVLGQTQHGRINAKDIIPRADKDDLGSITLQWEAFLEDSQFFSSFILKQTTADYTVLWSDPAAPRNLTISDPLGAVDFLFVPAIRAAASTDTFTAQVSGDAELRFAIDADGTINWGGGAVALNVNLYWDSADTLKTDDGFALADTAILAASTTPSVQGGNIFRTIFTASITDFTNDVNGQIITIICANGDSTTTLVDSTPLLLAAAFTCSQHDVIMLVSDGSVWYEISRSVN